MAKLRGRPARAGEPATARIEVRLTMQELRDVRALADANGSSMADLIRLALLDIAADSGDGGPVAVGRRLRAALLAGKNSAGV